MSDSPENVRARVARRYTQTLQSIEAKRAGETNQAGACCSPSPAADAAPDTRAQAGSGGACCATDLAAPTTSSCGTGYGPEAERHAQAAQSSLGCGNPLAFADVQAGDVVLDLGCGAGLDLLVAAERTGPEGRVIGVDMTDAMLNAARANVAQAGFEERVEVRQGLIEALPVDDSSVDFVVSNCVVNLSPEKERVFAELFRVLRPGGRFRIADIVADELPPKLREDPAAWDGCLAGAIGEGPYREGLAGAGLVDIDIAERAPFEIEDAGLFESVVIVGRKPAA